MSLLKTSSSLRKPKPANSVAKRSQEERPTKTVKASTSTEVAVVKSSRSVALPPTMERPAFISKTHYEKIKSAFGSGAPAIIDMLERDNNDGALTAINRTLMQTLVDILPVSEAFVRKTKGRAGLHQFNMTISQIRELAADIQSLHEKGQMGARVIERFIQPFLQTLAQQIVLSYTMIGAEAKKVMSKEDYEDFDRNVLRRMQFNLADFMQKQFASIEKDVAQAFS